MRIERTRRGARIVDDDVVLSEILREPGATHTLFDVLGAAVATFAPGPRLAVLGFAGGGMVAPLRAAGCSAAIAAVDLDLAGVELFREVSGDAIGDVNVAQGDAVLWLRSSRRHYDCIVEDLSMPSPAGTVKPYVSLDPLPALIKQRLVRGGVAITNVLPLPGTSWSSILARLAIAHEKALVVILDEYENRILIAGDALPSAAAASRAIRATLRGFGSYQAEKISVRTLSNSSA